MVNLIEIDNLTYWYGQNKDAPVLRNINLSIHKGEFIAIVGPNGCGKSTLIRHFNGLLLPSGGKALVAGLDTGEPKNLPVIRGKVGMVFQNPDTQLFASVVEEDVAFGVENLCLSRDEIINRVGEALALVGMEEYRHHPPHRLSGGQKQKVAIAGILAMQPECIVLDEPTSMLDTGGKREIMEAVRALNVKFGITVVLVTHDMEETLYCHRILALMGGKAVFSGRPGKFFTDVTLLDSLGLQAPPVRELVNGLISEGVDLSPGINTAEELVDALCS